jgi:hypothetical protein
MVLVASFIWIIVVLSYISNLILHSSFSCTMMTVAAGSLFQQLPAQASFCFDKDNDTAALRGWRE